MRKTVKQLREEHEMSQFKLAAESGVSLSTITGIENRRHEPSVIIAQKIAKALGVSVDEIDWPVRKENPKGEPTAA